MDAGEWSLGRESGMHGGVIGQFVPQSLVRAGNEAAVENELGQMK